MADSGQSSLPETDTPSPVQPAGIGAEQWVMHSLNKIDGKLGGIEGKLNGIEGRLRTVENRIWFAMGLAVATGTAVGIGWAALQFFTKFFEIMPKG